MEIVFEVWNKKHGRFATEEECSKHVSLQYVGDGVFVQGVMVVANDPLEIRDTMAEEKRLQALLAKHKIRSYLDGKRISN